MADLIGDILGRNNSPEAEERDETDDINDPEYRAYKIDARAVECELRTVNPAWHGLPFAYTYSVIGFAQDWSYFWVVTSFMLIKVKGRRLRPVIKALRARKVGYLQEFNKAIHRVPQDETAPVITQIEVIIQPAGQSYKDAAESYGPPG